MKSLFRLFVAIFFVSSLVFVTYWLWQRQPKITKVEGKTIPKITLEKSEPANEEISTSISDGQVLNTTKTDLKGKAKENSWVLVYSNNFDKVNLTQNGDFQEQLEFTSGLNLLTISILDKDFKEIQNKALNIYVSKDTKASLVYAGSVKSIFDKVTTLTTTNGEKKVRTNQETKTLAPSPTPKTKTQDVDIRVGDFMIALGKESEENEILAQEVNIIRENKPQLTKKFTPVTILTLPKNNLMSGKSGPTEDKTIEFTLDKNTKIYESGKTLDQKALTRDKKAIVFYTTNQEKNSPTSIFLIP